MLKSLNRIQVLMLIFRRTNIIYLTEGFLICHLYKNFEYKNTQD